MPTKVMPICTVDRKRPGSSARASARLAPLRPVSAKALSFERRAETIASSDRANTPFKTTRHTTIKISSTDPLGRLAGNAGPLLYDGAAITTELPVAVNELHAGGNSGGARLGGRSLLLAGSDGNASGVEEARAGVDVELTDSGGATSRILDAGDGTGER